MSKVEKFKKDLDQWIGFVDCVSVDIPDYFLGTNEERSLEVPVFDFFIAAAEVLNESP